MKTTHHALAWAAFIAALVVTGIMWSLGGKIAEKRAADSAAPEPASSLPAEASSTGVSFIRQDIAIDPGVSRDFSLSDVKNIPDIEKAYGFTFSSDELARLAKDKFVIKNILDTSLVKNGLPLDDNGREMVGLYGKVAGAADYKTRTQANAVFISSDSLMHLFSILSADLLKETENRYLSADTLSITKAMYDAASAKLAAASAPADRAEWAKVRSYFAIPYALLSTSLPPVSADDYWNSEDAKKGVSLEEVQANFAAKDKDADSFENASAFVQKLGLDSASEKAVLADLKQIYDAADGRGTPAIFAAEWGALPPAIEPGIPFTLFKPRGTYTNTSLRRQYFRAVQWYQQIPFLLGSKDLSHYATDIGALVKSDPAVASKFDSFSSFIAFIVGESDDLDASDYAAAASDLGPDKSRDMETLIDYLNKRKPPARIKAMPVAIDPSAPVSVADELDAIRGMRFMSQKFIPDSYWTGKLTQGDELPDVNGKRLSDKASMLEVMTILGSPYAAAHLPDLPFYAEFKPATDSRLATLAAEAKGWGDAYWQKNLYTSSIWTVSGMFDWLEANRSALPRFMQSPLWSAKTLLTDAGFWTELRHTSLLYAKQSFAEKGGGSEGYCDTRTVPLPPKGYVEPQPEAYDRLSYTARALDAEYASRGYQLQNLPKLESFIKLLDIVREYTKLELENTAMDEKTVDANNANYGSNCIEHSISPDSAIVRGDGYYDKSPSRWEELRYAIVNRMRQALPVPIEGPVLPIKDRRAAVVADIHTDKDGGVLEEGTGVPRMIFVAVDDANGPRLTVGFTYSQYETVSSDRLTDETWQSGFYADSENDWTISYKPKDAWPDINPWFTDLLGSK